MALTALITDPELVAAKDPIEIGCTAPDDELLFVEWLNALIYEMRTTAPWARLRIFCREQRREWI